MATIFQIRRGTTSVTLADGELYLNKSLGSIQFSSGSNNPITLLPLNAPVVGNINLEGSITSSLPQGYTWVGNGAGKNQAFATSSLSTFRQNVSVISSNTNASPFVVYVLTAGLTLTLPSSPTVGDWIKIANFSNTTTCTLARNGNKIMGLSEDLILDDAQASFEIIYASTAYGWVVIGAN